MRKFLSKSEMIQKKGILPIANLSKGIFQSENQMLNNVTQYQ